jgi:hypothetical protein
MTMKLPLILGLAASALALPQAFTFWQESAHQGIQQHHQSITVEFEVEPDVFQVQPSCDPVNDPSSCRSS